MENEIKVGKNYKIHGQDIKVTILSKNFVEYLLINAKEDSKYGLVNVTVPYFLKHAVKVTNKNT